MNHNSKVTIIIATATAPLEFFIQAILSIIIRTPNDYIDQIIVSINGPDIRTGDVLLQNRKEEFLKTFAKLGYPITIIRTWSRLDASRAFQLCLPLVKTQYYLIMHDDLIVLDSNWFQKALKIFQEKNCSIIMSPWIIDRKIQCHCPNQDVSVIDFFAINTVFMLADASKCYNNWTSYFNLSSQVSVSKDFIDYHKNKKHFDYLYKNVLDGPNSPIEYDFLPQDDKIYTTINMSMGTWVYYNEQDRIKKFAPKTIYHFCHGSTKENALADANAPSCELKFLEEDIKSKNLIDLYYEFLPFRKNREIKLPSVVSVERNNRLEFPRVLISVCVYSKIDIVEKWMRLWYFKYNTYNSKIALIHNFDGEEPNQVDKERLLRLQPDYYVPRFNRGQDIGVFQDILEKRLSYFQPDYDLLFCFTDDTIPVHKDFLGKFMELAKETNVSLIAPFVYYNSARSNCFGTKKGQSLEFPNDPVITKLQCHTTERIIPRFIIESGFKIRQLPTCQLSPHLYLVWDVDEMTDINMEYLFGEEY